MSETSNPCMLGWVRDFADPRDLDVKADEVQPFKLAEETMPETYTIPILPPHFDQEQIGSCVANAEMAKMRIFQSQIAGVVVPPLSRLFCYKVARNIMGVKGDTGSYLRTGAQVAAMFGSLPESMYPYYTSQFDNEPTAFHYAAAQSYQGLTYYRLDPAGKDPLKVIESIKLNVFNNRACTFGFSVYSNLDQRTGDVPLPGKNDRLRGGHAGCIVGWDDKRKVGDRVGAFRDFNSWGESIGDHGDLWIPYDYFRLNLASDVWTLMSMEWLDLDIFG